MLQTIHNYLIKATFRCSKFVAMGLKPTNLPPCRDSNPQYLKHTSRIENCVIMVKKTFLEADDITQVVFCFNIVRLFSLYHSLSLWLSRSHTHSHTLSFLSATWVSKIHEYPTAFAKTLLSTTGKKYLKLELRHSRAKNGFWPAQSSCLRDGSVV